MTKGNRTIDNDCHCESSEIGKEHLPPKSAYQDSNGNNINDINIAEYVQNLPDDVRNKIAGFIGTGIIDQQTIDIENVVHYLVVSRFSNELKSACEAKLLATLTPENSLGYLTIAERFSLGLLRTKANQLYNKIFLVNNNPIIPLSPQQYPKPKQKSSTSYNVLFTCDTSCVKRTISVVVLNTDQDVKCYKTIKKGKKISNQFRCCCIQNDENNAPYVYWSCGKSFCRYDPMLNKYKKMNPLNLSRSNFSLVAYGEKCYAIGGVCSGQTVRQIERYDTRMKRWDIVATIPEKCQMSYLTCVKFQNLIYIFTGAENIQGCNPRTVVGVFDPTLRRVSLKSEIPMSFNKITGCSAGEHIYLASDSGDFIRYLPRNDSYEILGNQLSKCKYFGMYEANGDIYLAGGVNEDGKSNDTIRKFCTSSFRWQRHGRKLPDCLCMNGTCGMDIPRTCTIVPFYESNVFEKRC